VFVESYHVRYLLVRILTDFEGRIFSKVAISLQKTPPVCIAATLCASCPLRRQRLVAATVDATTPLRRQRLVEAT
jgi:hypothetical protein